MFNHTTTVRKKQSSSFQNNIHVARIVFISKVLKSGTQLLPHYTLQQVLDNLNNYKSLIFSVFVHICVNCCILVSRKAHSIFLKSIVNISSCFEGMFRLDCAQPMLVVKVL